MIRRLVNFTIAICLLCVCPGGCARTSPRGEPSDHPKLVSMMSQLSAAREQWLSDGARRVHQSVSISPTFDEHSTLSWGCDGKGASYRVASSTGTIDRATVATVVTVIEDQEGRSIVDDGEYVWDGSRWVPALELARRRFPRQAKAMEEAMQRVFPRPPATSASTAPAPPE
ncbi:MAG TPA: hypothetical protein VFB66_12410 [Tepidisphaeraceae bacterium]|nr:hypothetical protein [Tepidisphaeraceae bacterium]